jgi:transposase
MPWKEVTAVNERMEFVARLKAGERMTDLCREFGISRKTGYKFERRYEEHGPRGLYDVSRRPRRLARQVSAGIQTAILDLKRDQPTWGAAKIQEVLRRRHPEMEVPVRSTIHDLLDRYGLVKKRSPNGGAIMPTRRFENRTSRLRTNCGAPTLRGSSAWGMRSTVIR